MSRTAPAIKGAISISIWRTAARANSRMQDADVIPFSPDVEDND